MFGSNYLSLLNLSDTNYPVKRISLSDDMNCTFTVLVGNYVWGDESLYNPKDITYTVTAKLLSMDGGDLSADYSSIKINGTPFGDAGELTSKNQILPTGKAATNEYKFEIPGSLKDKVKISVKDSGIGIPEEKQSMIFDKFNQVIDDSSKQKNGSGLGLTITKHLIDLHGGEIYVESKVGEGSEFIIILPVNNN